MELVIKYIVEVPAARPSSPSHKLIAFIMDTINKTAIGYANIPKWKVVPNMVISARVIFP